MNHTVNLISIPKFDSIWAKAQELEVIILLHPDEITQGEQLAENYFIDMLGNPMDTTIVVHHLIFKGVLERYPRLRIILAHGEGFLPGYSGWMDHAWSARADADGKLPHPPTTYLKKLYFNTCVFTHHQLKYLVDVYGADHIIMGTDYPFDMAEFRPIEHMLETPGLSVDQITALVSGNAHTHLKLAGQ